MQARHVVQMFLPLCSRRGNPHPQSVYQRTRDELTARFGGLTAYSVPATGIWDDGRRKERDDIVIYEVACDALDESWWSDYRTALEQRFEQVSLMVRAFAIRQL